MVGGLLKAQLRHLANENLGEVPKLRTKGVSPTSRYPFRRIANGCPPIGLQITACSEHESQCFRSRKAAPLFDASQGAT